MSTNQTPALEVPDEWLPGDSFVDYDGITWTLGEDGWKYRSAANGSEVAINADAATYWAKLPGSRITLVPRVPAPEPLPLGVPAGWVRRALGDVIRAGEPYACMTGLHGIVTTYPTGPVGDLVVRTDGIAPAVEVYTAPPPERNHFRRVRPDTHIVSGN